MAGQDDTENRGKSESAEETSKSIEEGRRRLRSFQYHLVGYFLVMIVIVPLNLLTTPENPWFVWPMVGWGSVLAVHTAWVMRLF